VTRGVMEVKISQGMVFALAATSETGMWEPKSSTSSPMRQWGRAETSTMIWSMVTRPRRGQREWRMRTSGLFPEMARG